MSKEAKIWTAVNEKGGVAKSSLLWCLAGELAERGFKVLLIDADYKIPPSTEEAYKNAPFLEPSDKSLKLLYKARERTIDENPEYNLLDFDLEQVAETDDHLTKALLDYAFKYDYILVDTAGDLTPAQLQAIAVSEHVLTPIPPNPAAMEGTAFNNLINNFIMVEHNDPRDAENEYFKSLAVRGQSHLNTLLIPMMLRRQKDKRSRDKEMIKQWWDSHPCGKPFFSLFKVGFDEMDDFEQTFAKDGFVPADLTRSELKAAGKDLRDAYNMLTRYLIGDPTCQKNIHPRVPKDA